MIECSLRCRRTLPIARRGGASIRERPGPPAFPCSPVHHFLCAEAGRHFYTARFDEAINTRYNINQSILTRSHIFSRVIVLATRICDLILHSVTASRYKTYTCQSGLFCTPFFYVECRPSAWLLVSFTEEMASGSKDTIGRGVVDLDDPSFHCLIDTSMLRYFINYVFRLFLALT